MRLGIESDSRNIWIFKKIETVFFVHFQGPSIQTRPPPSSTDKGVLSFRGKTCEKRPQGRLLTTLWCKRASFFLNFFFVKWLFGSTWNAGTLLVQGGGASSWLKKTEKMTNNNLFYLKSFSPLITHHGTSAALKTDVYFSSAWINSFFFKRKCVDSNFRAWKLVGLGE